MDSTELAMSAIREEWIAQDRPPPSRLASSTNMPAITIRRYLDGSTKHGDPAKVRALAIALGRRDIAESVKDNLAGDISEKVMHYMSEKFLLWRESNLDELAKRDAIIDDQAKNHAAEIVRLTGSHQQIADRLLTENERLQRSKDSAVEQYTTRITQLETDKANIYREMDDVRKTKRKHDAHLILSLVLNIAAFIFIVCYMLFIDAPNGSYGLIRY